MSAIPPHLPALRPSVPAPTPAARADFFKAALASVQAASGTGEQPAAEPTRQTPTRTQPPVAPEDRPARPGTLLDIRV